MNRTFRLVLAVTEGSRIGARQATASSPPAVAPGQSATVLPDGRWLLIGGERDRGRVAVWDPRTRTGQPLTTGPSVPRAWHTATVLPDGSVIVIGGIDAQEQLVQTPERFDPATGRFTPIESAVLTPRAHHTATLLTDRRVLLAGGAAPDATGAEMWYPELDAAFPVSSAVLHARRNHSAQLLADGRVLLAGGVDDAGRPVAAAELFDPATDLFISTEAAGTSIDEPGRVLSIPADGAVDVPVQTRMALRFGDLLDVTSVRTAIVALNGPAGVVRASAVAAEGGRLLFVTPAEPLPFESLVSLQIRGLRAAAGHRIADLAVTFTTERAPETDPPVQEPPDVWTPGGPDWRMRAADSPWRTLPPLSAPKGVTALAGQALLLNGSPLADVTVEIDGHVARTDRSGRFLLHLGALPGGWYELEIEGATANQARRRFGRFEYGLTIVEKRTNVLPFTIWMPVLDTANAVRIPSPTREETVVTTPHIPGLELRLPAGTVITDEEGRIVREISITPIPVDRPPFPLPQRGAGPHLLHHPARRGVRGGGRRARRARRPRRWRRA